jgi:hypothetical protein
MARLRNVTDETLNVPLADKHVAPDEVFEVSDATFATHEWAESLFAVVDAPKRIFDPSSKTVEQVVAYLEKADDEEKQRVLAAERAGKARAGVLREDGESA